MEIAQKVHRLYILSLYEPQHHDIHGDYSVYLLSTLQEVIDHINDLLRQNGKPQLDSQTVDRWDSTGCTGSADPKYYVWKVVDMTKKPFAIYNHIGGCIEVSEKQPQLVFLKTDPRYFVKK